MATVPLLERVLFGHVLTEREAQLIGATAISVNLAFTALGICFYAFGVATGSFPALSMHLTSVLLEIAYASLCLLLWFRRHVGLLCLVVALGFLGGGLATWFSQGGMAPQLVGYNTMGVLLAGLLFGSRGALAMAASIAAVATWFYFAQWPDDPELVATFHQPNVVWAVQIACAASAAGLAHLGYRRLQGALAVAERRRLDLELRTAQLDESREHFRLIAEHASDMLSEYTLEGDCLYLNAASRRFFGLDSLPTDLEQALAFVHPDHHANLRDLKERVQESRGEEFVSVNRVRGADGDWRWLEARVVRFQPPLGPPRLISVSRDITEYKRTEEELERRVAERTRELEEALERLRAEGEARARIQESLHQSQHLASIGTLAAGIAHEVNNPVGSILAAADHAQRLFGEPASRREVETLLKKISHEAARCGRFVKSVLALSRQAAGDRWLGNLNEVVRSSRDHLRELAARGGARLDFELDPSLAPFPMNPTELEQVVVNLVQNAIESGGPGVRVRILTEAAPQGARLRVLDDGPGIPPAERERIFDPLYTTRRSQGGVGLGLSLVHGIVSRHGGSIEIRGEPGSGTEFALEFPVREEAT